MPGAREILVVKGILNLFECAMGPSTNFSKSQSFPVNCLEAKIRLATSMLRCHVADFIPLHLFGSSDVHFKFVEGCAPAFGR
jgi:hypothetical protein